MIPFKIIEVTKRDKYSQRHLQELGINLFLKDQKVFFLMKVNANT